MCFSDILDSDTEKGDEPAKCPQDGDDTQDETLMTENDVRLLSVFHTCSRGLRVTNKRGGLAPKLLGVGVAAAPCVPLN